MISANLAFTFTDWLWLLTALLALLPLKVLFTHYSRTRIKEYLFLFFAIFSTFLIVFFLAYSKLTIDIPLLNLVMYQGFLLGCASIPLFIFLYVIRIRWETPPKLLLSLVFFWFFLLVVLTLFSRLMSQPDAAPVLIWDNLRQHSYSFFHPNGVGLTTSTGIIIYASSFPLLGLFFALAVECLKIYIYVRTELVLPTDHKLRRVRILWIVSACILAICYIFLLPWSYNEIFALIAVILFYIVLNYIVIRYPEYVLISSVQLIRARNLYDKISSLQTSAEIQEFGLKSLVDYLKSIPSDIFTPTNGPPD